MLLGIGTCQVAIFTYFIVSTELLLIRNPGPDNSAGEWGFGQIIALVVVIPSIFSVMEAFAEVGFKRVHRRRRQARRTEPRKDQPEKLANNNI